MGKKKKTHETYLVFFFFFRRVGVDFQRKGPISHHCRGALLALVFFPSVENSDAGSGHVYTNICTYYVIREHTIIG